MNKSRIKDVNGWNISFFLLKCVFYTHSSLYLQY